MSKSYFRNFRSSPAEQRESESELDKGEKETAEHSANLLNFSQHSGWRWWRSCKLTNMRGRDLKPSRCVYTNDMAALCFVFVPAHLLLAADINHSVPIGFLSQLWQYAPQAWPANAKVEAWKMAKAGLRYTGQEEEVHINVQCSVCVKIKNLCRGKLWFQKLTGFSSQVTCAWCGCVLGDWQYGDQVCTSSSIYFNAQRN